MLRTNYTGRFCLSASVLALLVAVSAPASAQSETAQEDDNIATDTLPQSQADPTLPPEQEQEALVVTGTRIRTTQFDFANPVVSIDSSAIQNSGTTNLTSFLTDTPALVGSFDAVDASGSAAPIGFVGLNLLDLRNLGTSRTLVLVDGRRHVSSVPGSSAVDINTIPVDLTDRVDILTGGASALYGADAVTGVVNFITKRDFQGVNIRAQAGISDKGDGAQQFVSVTAGQNFADNRGNIALSFEYGHEDRFLREQRRRFRSENFRAFYDNLDDSPDDPSVPDLLLFSDVRYFDSSPNGAIDVDFDLAPDFLGDGSPFDPGTYIGSIFQVGGSGTPVATYGGELLPKVDRYVANAFFNYDLTEGVNVYAQAKYARVDAASEGQPTFDFTIITPFDNPFLPANVRAAAEANGLPFVIVNRDNLDIGRRGENNRRETYRGVVGLTAELLPDISLDASYVYGESDSVIRQTRTRFNDRFLAAVDAVRDPATGNIVCRSNIRPIGESDQPFYNFGTGFFFSDFDELSFTPGPNSGCVPFNLFSEQQAPGAIDFLLTDAVDRSELTQHVASAVISGDLGERIRLWGGDIGFAIGAEYREEKSRSNPDPVNTTGLTFGNALFPEVGKFNVKEAFLELRVPIVTERPFFHDLTVNGAVRFSDYSTVGGTTAYQIGGVYAPVRDVRFRGTYAQAVRAPNIGELFGPQNQTFAFITDPCAPDEVDDGTEFRSANCQSLLQGLGLSAAQLADFTGDTSSSIPGTSGGNRDLREETAKTITAGVVLQPRFIRGLTLSADFYDVEIEDAVSTPTAEDVAELCVDQPSLDNVFCDAITRNPGSNVTAPGVISNFRTIPQNVARFSTRGVDFAANYRLVPGGDIGTFNFRLVGNYLDELEFIPTPGADVINQQNTANAPEWQLNADLTWVYQQLTLNYGFNYFSETRRFSRQTTEADPDVVAPEFLKFDARHTHDLQASYNVDNRLTFYGGVRNLFDQESDVGSFTYPVGGPVGRFIYFGAKVNFPGLL